MEFEETLEHTIGNVRDGEVCGIFQAFGIGNATVATA
jgi:hypothetical protein